MSEIKTRKSPQNATYHSFPDFDFFFSSLLTAFFNVPSWSATLPPLARSSALAHLSRSSISFRLSAGRLASLALCFSRCASA